jgi:hypothetical protein
MAVVECCRMHLDRKEFQRRYLLAAQAKFLGSACPVRAIRGYRQWCPSRQKLSTPRAHMDAVSEQLAIQAVRLGSILKSRALHSAMQDTCVASQPAAPGQLSQMFAGCALREPGDRNPAKNNARTDSLTVASSLGISAPPGSGGRPGGARDAEAGMRRPGPRGAGYGRT